MFLDDTACNLASLNLMHFRTIDGEFDVEAFKHAVDVVLLAQEIIVGFSQVPHRADRPRTATTTARWAWATPTSARC